MPFLSHQIPHLFYLNIDLLSGFCIFWQQCCQGNAVRSLVLLVPNLLVHISSISRGIPEPPIHLRHRLWSACLINAFQTLCSSHLPLPPACLKQASSLSLITISYHLEQPSSISASSTLCLFLDLICKHLSIPLPAPLNFFHSLLSVIGLYLSLMYSTDINIVPCLSVIHTM